MSRYFDDELAHSGVKGMKWRKHKYKLVKDKNGKPIYVYYTGPQKRAVEDCKYHPKNEHDLPLNKLGFSQSGNKNEATGAGGNFQKPNYSLRPDRNTTGTAKAIPRKKRVKTDRLESKKVGASNKSETVKRGQVANNQKAKATGKRASWAPDKPYKSKVEYDQEHQRYWLKERDKLRKQGEPSLLSPPYRNGSASKYHDEFYKDQQRNTRRSMEGFETGLSSRNNSPSLAGPGHRARAAESTARHKAAVKAQKKKKITNMIDKGKKVVENFKSEVENEAPRIGKAVAGTFKYGTKYNLASRDASSEKDRSNKAKTARSKEHAARAKMEKDAQNKKLSTHLNRTKRALTDTFTPKKKKKR